MKAIRFFFARKIVKAFSYSAVSTLIKMLTGFIMMKFVALRLGPGGIAMLGQLNNFINIALPLASGGILLGVTKYVSEHKGDNQRCNSFLSAGLQLTLFSSALVAALILAFNGLLSKEILMSDQYRFVFFVFAVSLTLYSLNNFWMAVLNGLQELRGYTILAISNSVGGIVFTVILVYLFELHGLLVASVTYQSATAVIAIMLIWRSRRFSKNDLRIQINWPIYQSYFKYSLMAFTTAAFSPLIQLYLRSRIIDRFSLTDAGIWEGMNRLSLMYLLVVTTSFTVYYLPRLAEIKDRNALKLEIGKGYRFIMPLVAVICILMYLFRDLIIGIVYSKSFLPMSELFIWQLGGDLFKIATWLIYFIFLAKAKTKHFIATEIVTNIAYLIGAVVLMEYNGIAGVVQGYLLGYFISFILMGAFFKRIINSV